MNNCKNSTMIEFYMTPFSTSRREEIFIFTGFLFMYLQTMLGNLIIIALICGVRQLHTPMYFFLCNVSYIDVIYVSAIFPNMMSIMLTGDKTISFHDCLTQMSFYIFCGIDEIYILTAMAYDRYVAVCSPLQYALIMTRRVCIITSISYVFISAANSLMFYLMVSNLSFCNSHQINHFFCEILQVLALASSDTKRVNIIISIEDICLLTASFMLILTSYYRIISTILKIRSSGGRLKAFSSCSSHIITVLLFYGPCIFTYTKPKSEHSKEQDKILSMFYVVVVPMLNPFVYSLRNKEVLGAARKMIKVISIKVTNK